MLNLAKLLIKSLIPIAFFANVYAQTGLFVGGAVNIQQNSYSKANANTNASFARKVSALTSKQIEDLKTQMAELKTQINSTNKAIEDLNAQLPGEININDLSPELLEGLSIAQNAIWDEINRKKEENNQLYAQLKEMERKIKESNQEEAAILQESKLHISNEELNKIKSSASRIEPSISLLAGYSVKNGNFGFITEAGVDLNFSKVGNNDGRELQVENIYNLYLTEKIGYYLHREMLLYATGGFGIKDTKITYVGTKEKQILSSLILGFGFERNLEKNLSMFGEFNHIFSLTSAKTAVGDVKTKSEQVKIGVRYYF